MDSVSHIPDNLVFHAFLFHDMTSGNPRLKRIIIIISVAFALGVISLLMSLGGQPAVTWNVIDVSGDNQSGDAHVLEFSDGTVILIDTGFRQHAEAKLIPFLKHKKISRIHHMIITHGHRNHYGGLLSLIDAGIQPDIVYFNLPPEDACNAEKWAMGCQYQHIIDTQAVIRQKGIPVSSLKPGQVIYKNTGFESELVVLYAFDGINSPPANVGVNDSSAVLKLTVGNTSGLFTADIGDKVGKYLVEHGERLDADIMTAPHHGVEVMAPNEFFDRVTPEIIIASVSRPPLMGDRGKRLRRYASDRGIPLYASGVHGRIEVNLDKNEYSIKTERNETIE